MPMRACEKCLENNWRFEKIEDVIRATCETCDYEVEFQARKSKYNRPRPWVRFETIDGKRKMFTDEYLEGVEVYLDMNVNFKKEHPIRIFKNSQSNIFK